ncbi:MAG TPA: hypothetical protein PKA32_03095 [Candidatus Gracilibacteria bacterium]|nr:hypothetical protein [Candidatus Gracilibacteria bacterium]
MPDEDIQQKEEATKEILKQAKVDLPEEEQMKMGKPLKDDSGVNPADLEFLQMLMSKIEDGEIDLHVPSSLLNEPVYEALSEEAQGKADYNAMTLLSTIRQIRQLWEMGDKESYQIQNLVHQVRMTKERLEEVGGDIYII